MTFRAFRSVEEWVHGMGRVPTVATVGNFDGVHLGHELILRRVVERARTLWECAGTVTFDPHPMKLLRHHAAPPLIATIDQRLRRFAAAGIDAALILRFTPEFARLSPEEFVERILARALACSVVFVGENFRFGHGQAGDVALLTELGKRFGFLVEVVPAVQLRGKPISSTLVRQSVAASLVERAGRMLGRPFALTGEIRPGMGRGRQLVVPTLNLAYEQELVPGGGVYATESVVGGSLYRSVTNVGLRPTFSGSSLTVESYLLGFCEQVNSGPMEVRFWKRLREEKKFASPDELRAQVLRDIELARKYFARRDRRCRPLAGDARPTGQSN
jgi:riboflavin kinase/FMN adenylyltransferase